MALRSRIVCTTSRRALAARGCIPARLHLPEFVQRIATRRLTSEVVLGVGRFTLLAAMQLSEQCRPRLGPLRAQHPPAALSSPSTSPTLHAIGHTADEHLLQAGAPAGSHIDEIYLPALSTPMISAAGKPRSSTTGSTITQRPRLESGRLLAPVAHGVNIIPAGSEVNVVRVAMAIASSSVSRACNSTLSRYGRVVGRFPSVNQPIPPKECRRPGSCLLASIEQLVAGCFHRAIAVVVYLQSRDGDAEPLRQVVHNSVAICHGVHHMAQRGHVHHSGPAAYLPSGRGSGQARVGAPGDEFAL